MLSPDAAVLPHLELIGARLLKSDTATVAERVQSLAEAQRALDGLYDLDQRTVALLRALEAACSASAGHGLPVDLVSDAAGYLKAARYRLEAALLLRVRV